VNIIRKITPDKVIEEIETEKELTDDEKRILKSIFEDDDDY
jgi:hypothetical protein